LETHYGIGPRPQRLILKQEHFHAIPDRMSYVVRRLSAAVRVIVSRSFIDFLVFLFYCRLWILYQFVAPELVLWTGAF